MNKLALALEGLVCFSVGWHPPSQLRKKLAEKQALAFRPQ